MLLETVGGLGTDNTLWHLIPFVHDPLTEEMISDTQLKSFFIKFLTVTSQPMMFQITEEYYN